MNIGIDIRAAKWYRGTGIGTYSYQLINAINKIDTLNKYILFSDCNSTPINFNSNFKICSTPNINTNNFWESVSLPINLNNEDLNIYHVPQNGIGLPLDHNLPFVITLHDTIPAHMPETVGDKYLSLFNSSMEDIVNRCDGIITVSNFSKEDISKDFNFPKEKIYVIYLASEDIYKPLDKILCSTIIKKYYSK